MKAIKIRNKLIDEINLSGNKNLLEEFYNYLKQENKVQETYRLIKNKTNL